MLNAFRRELMESRETIGILASHGMVLTGAPVDRYSRGLPATATVIR